MIKNFILRIYLPFIILCISNFALAQEVTQSTKAEMADALRADGKIYVVVLVVMIVFTFFSMYLLLTDRHVKKLEKEINELKEKRNLDE